MTAKLYHVVIWELWGLKKAAEHYFDEEEIKVAVEIIKEDPSIKCATLYSPHGKGFGISIK